MEKPDFLKKSGFCLTNTGGLDVTQAHFSRCVIAVGGWIGCDCSGGSGVRDAG
jgi:hypothetical protein